jgi:hypothetical protein
LPCVTNTSIVTHKEHSYQKLYRKIKMGKEKIETVNGKYSKFEIYRIDKAFGGKEFSIYKDGELWKVGIDSLAKAVQIAEDGG